MFTNVLKRILSCILVVSLLSCNTADNSGIPELATEVVTGVTQSTAVSGGNFISTGGSDITERGVCWHTDVEPTVLDHHTSDGIGNGNFVSFLTGLTPKTEYHIRAYAKNDDGIGYGEERIFRTLSNTPFSQIIADHTIVDQFDNIPQYYINEVKKMWVSYAGESHSEGIRNGMLALEAIYPAYSVSVVESGTPEPYTTSNLRLSRATWGDLNNATGWIYSYGDEDWFYTETAIARTQAGFLHCHTQGPALYAIGFGWCYDPNPDGLAYGIQYNAATDRHVAYCAANNIPTKVFYTTATVDSYVDGMGYQQSLKSGVIRSHVLADPTRILFDYADILCYDDGNETPNTYTWDGHTYNIITTKNLTPTKSSHISAVGEVRLAKAMWWMLARMAGWDGAD